MIRRIQAKNYRCFEYIDQPLQDFQLLVGPNASGKTTFLDILLFLSDLLQYGLKEAIYRRSKDFNDLLHCHKGDRFELAIEMEIPDSLLRKNPQQYITARYEISIGFNDSLNEFQIYDEQFLLYKTKRGREIAGFFPPATIITSRLAKNECIRILKKKYGSNDNFFPEIQSNGKKNWVSSFKLGPKNSALANLPEDEDKFPVAIWFREKLKNQTKTIMLNSLKLRESSPPGTGSSFLPDGSNLPWVIYSLRQNNKDCYQRWLDHLRTAFPKIQDITTGIEQDRKHRFLKIHYDGDLIIPSWMVSDGTLRMLALTILAYLPDLSGIFLIEEPENGIHPLALETIFQSLCSVYSSQILIATHSPILLGCSTPEQILCFSKSEKDAVNIIQGTNHRYLRNWNKEVDLSVLFASGVLG